MPTFPPDKFILDVPPDESTVDVAARTLHNRLHTVLHYLILAATEEDPDGEHVHQLRVWSRRAIAALDLYWDLMPRRRREWMRKQLKRIRRASGDARDCDVLVQRLKAKRSTKGRKRWLESLSIERAKQQWAIVAFHDRRTHDDRLARRIDALLARVGDDGEERYDGVPARFVDWAHAHLPITLEEFFAAVPVDPTDAAALHRFRIRGKQLRYAMELLAGAFPEQFHTTLYATIEALQDRLGEINDLVTAKARLQETIATADGAADVAAWRRLLAQERAQLDRARCAFAEWCTSAMLSELRQGFATVLCEPPAISSPAPSRRATGVLPGARVGADLARGHRVAPHNDGPAADAG
jgi:CHAD domain-containing protein